MDGRETVGNSLGRALLGGGETEATTGWTDGKPREIAFGEGSVGRERQQGWTGNRGKQLWESSVGRERDGSDDRDARETVGNSLGRAPLGGMSETEATGVSGQIPSTRLSRKTGAKDFPNGV